MRKYMLTKKERRIFNGSFLRVEQSTLFSCFGALQRDVPSGQVELHDIPVFQKVIPGNRLPFKSR